MNRWRGGWLVLASWWGLWTGGMVEAAPASEGLLQREAAVLEMQGRLNEALDRYRALAQRTDQPSVEILSRLAHLALDVGQGDAAWDAASRLMAQGTASADQAAAVIRLRLYILTKQSQPARDLWLRFVAKASAGNLGSLVTSMAHRQGWPLPKTSAWPLAQWPESKVERGEWRLLTSPAEIHLIQGQPGVRIQLGAFRESSHVSTMVAMLKEKGWVPYVERRPGNLQAVYIVSLRAEMDRLQLKKQGFDPVLPAH